MMLNLPILTMVDGRKSVALDAKTLAMLGIAEKVGCIFNFNENCFLEGSWNVENSFTAVQKQENGVAMPEWFDDGDEAEKP